MRKRNVILLSHHTLFLNGLREIIDKSKYYSVTACCCTESEFIEVLTKKQSDIAILDCSYLSSRAALFRVINVIVQIHPDLKLMMVGEAPRHEMLVTTFYPYISEYVCKSQCAPQFMMALARADTSQYRAYDIIHYGTDRACDNAVVMLENCISEKECQIIRLIHSGLTVSEVAEKVNRSVKTVSTQKRSAMKKLGLKHDKDLYTLNL